MISKALLTGIIGAGTLALFTWLGLFVQDIFLDTTFLLEQMSNGHIPTDISGISDSDMRKLEDLPNQVSELEN